MRYSVSEAAQMLKVGKQLIKTWAFKFKEYVGCNANPSKGTPRTFTINDIRVFCYVKLYWEDEPDIENIKIGLNSDGHFDIDIINDFILKNTPVFIDIPDNVEELAASGALVHGFASQADTFFIANAYKAAGDILINTALENEETWKLVNPVMYNYRHSIELYLKATIETSEHGHNLEVLMEKFRRMLQTDFNLAAPRWFEDIVTQMHKFDPGSTFFRYAENVSSDEVFIDFKHLKSMMDLLSQAFREIRIRQGLPS